MVSGASGRALGMAAALGTMLMAPPVSRPARAECRVVEVAFRPVPRLQIAIWIEDADGRFVDTVYLTRATASLGLGNRPGRLDFNSEILWPYGRRENVLPVWAHRRGVVYPRVVFQDGDENDLSHAISDSSLDPYYCRPLRAGEEAWENTIDLGTCATSAYTDKGELSATLTSLYPPRNDLVVRLEGDSDDMPSYGDLNGLDAVSRATPAGGGRVAVRWSMPADLPAGEYVAWIEVSRESDFNASYNPTVYPSPVGIPWSEYGHPYRGQPSVVWKLPFTAGASPGVHVTTDYAGYGDPEGLSGELSPPDETITTVAGRYDVPAGPRGNPPARTVDDLGAARLELETSPEGDYKLRVDFLPEEDGVPPGAPTDVVVDGIGTHAAQLGFLAPGDDGELGTVGGYEIRYGAGDPPDEAGFVHGTRVDARLPVVPPGERLDVPLAGLQPGTTYWVGVRAEDNCLNPSAVVFASFTTAELERMPVDACFVATAAWGSPLVTEVAGLRGFRDRFLRRQALGEIFVEAYYTFGPAFAEVIRPSDLLRAMTRRVLAPVVAGTRELR